MNKCIALLLFFIGSINAASAKYDSFNIDSELAFAEISTSHRGLDRAEQLVSNVENDEEKIQDHLLLAEKHKITGAIDSSIFYAERATEIAKSIFHISWQAYSDLFLVSTYRELGLHSFASKHLKNAEKLNEHQKEDPEYHFLKTRITQEKIAHAFSQNRYDAGMKFFEDCLRQCALVPASDKRSKALAAKNDYLLGNYYLHLGNLLEADSTFSEALKLLGENNDNLKPYLYVARAKVALDDQQLDSAQHQLLLAEPYLKEFAANGLKSSYLDAYASYYWQKNEFRKARLYERELGMVKETMTEHATYVYDELFYKLDKSTDSLSSQNQVILIVNLTLVAVILILFLQLFIFRKKENTHTTKSIKSEHPFEAEYLRSSEVLRAKAILSSNSNIRENPSSLAHTTSDLVTNYDAQTTNAMLTPIKEVQRVEHSEKSDLPISEETENRLLDLLEAQEEKHFYLRKNMTRADIAGVLGTNQRYISYIIRKHRGMDYYTYLQSCRINYILKRFKQEPQLLDYKMTKLASLAGFSDNSKFSTAFKAITGTTPSAYVQSIKLKLSSTLTN